MDGTRGDFLAGAGLAEEQDRRVGGCDLRDTSHDFAETRLGADNRAHDLLAVELGEQRPVVRFDHLRKSSELVQAVDRAERGAERIDEESEPLPVLLREATRSGDDD